MGALNVRASTGSATPCGASTIKPFPTTKYQSAMMEDRGSLTADHFDHLHITVNPAGDGNVLTVAPPEGQ